MIPERPHRSQIITLQRFAEFAMLIDQPEHAVTTMRAAADFGLIDVLWLDACPLFAPLKEEPRYRAIRAYVAARAAKVLTAFRAAAR
jgi:hypothetical protein